MSPADPVFPAEGFRFLAKLKRHNERDWFRQHKDEYVTSVEQPMEVIVLAMAERCRQKGLELYAREKSPVMRIYRDVRFSPNKQPYKTHVGAELRHSFRMGQGGVYLHLSPAESFVAAGMWQPERDVLRLWRDRIVASPAQFSSLKRTLARKDLELSREGALSRLPRGYQQHAGSDIEGDLQLASFITSRILDQATSTSPGFLDHLVRFAIDVKPLLEHCREIMDLFAAQAKIRIREEDLV